MGKVMSAESAKRVVAQAIDECDTAGFYVSVPARESKDYSKIIVTPVY
jgi:hypothetical protein